MAKSEKKVSLRERWVICFKDSVFKILFYFLLFSSAVCNCKPKHVVGGNYQKGVKVLTRAHGGQWSS